MTLQTPLTRRAFSVSALAAALTPAWANTWPTRPVKIIVPSPPGGSTDQLARAIGDKLATAWSQPVLVDNKPGAGLTLGADFVAKSAPDGNTLLMAAVHHSIAPAVYKKLPYDLLKDLKPITVLAVVPNVMITRKEFPADTVADFIALEKRNPRKYTYGSTGIGTAHHLIGEQFNDMAGTELRHVPYKGSAPALVDLMGGQIDFMFDTVASCLPHIQSGKLKALAVATAKRSSVLPAVPTLSEAGLPGFDIATWFGLMAPAGTPAGVIANVHADVVKIMATPEFKKQMAGMGAEPVGNTPAQMDAQIRAEVQKFEALARKAKLSAD